MAFVCVLTLLRPAGTKITTLLLGNFISPLQNYLKFNYPTPMPNTVLKTLKIKSRRGWSFGSLASCLLSVGFNEAEPGRRATKKLPLRLAFRKGPFSHSAAIFFLIKFAKYFVRALGGPL